MLGKKPYTSEAEGIAQAPEGSTFQGTLSGEMSCSNFTLLLDLSTDHFAFLFPQPAAKVKIHLGLNVTMPSTGSLPKSPQSCAQITEICGVASLHCVYPHPCSISSAANGREQGNAQWVVSN